MPNDNIPPGCMPIQVEIEGTEAIIEALRVDLENATSLQERHAIIQVLRRNQERLPELRRELEECIANPPDPPRPIPTLGTTFTGTATLTTADARFPGPFSSQAVATVTFVGEARATVTVASLSPISATFDVPVGPLTIRNTTTVRLLGGSLGTFDINTGRMQVTLRLRFDHSVTDQDSVATIPMTTDPPAGTPLSRTDGSITLVGASRFEGGLLDGTGLTLGLTGTIAPLPF